MSAHLTPELAVDPDIGELLNLRDAAASWLLERGIEHWNPGEFRSGSA